MISSEKTETPKTVKVTVNKPFRVIHPDTREAHTHGDELTLSKELSDDWIRFGWVNASTAKEK